MKYFYSVLCTVVGVAMAGVGKKLQLVAEGQEDARRRKRIMVWAYILMYGGVIAVGNSALFLFAIPD